MDKNKVLELYTQFNKVQNQFTAIRRTLVATDFDEPIYAAEMQVLALLNIHPKFTVTDIANELYITTSASSQLVKKLCSKGYLRKERNPENERIAIISLTELGHAAVKAFLGNETYMLNDVMSHIQTFDEDQIETIQQFLSGIEEMFDKKL